MTERRGSDGQRRAADPTALGRSATNTHWRNHLLERLERGDSLEHIDRDLRRIGGLSEEERAALWLLAWGEQQRRASDASGVRANVFPGGRDASSSECRSGRSGEVVVSTLELARAEMSMDVAVLGEIYDGREVVRLVAGEAESFGLAVGASAPVEERSASVCLRAGLATWSGTRLALATSAFATSRSLAPPELGPTRRSADHAGRTAVHPVLPGSRAATGAGGARGAVPSRAWRDDHPRAGLGAPRVSTGHGPRNQTQRPWAEHWALIVVNRARRRFRNP